MKLFFLLFFYCTINFAFAGGFKNHNIPCARHMFSYHFVTVGRERLNNSVNKEKTFLKFKNPEYNSPLYIYHDQLRISVSDNVKFWFFYNDVDFLNYSSKDNLKKYKLKVFGTFRFKIPW